MKNIIFFTTVLILFTVTTGCTKQPCYLPDQNGQYTILDRNCDGFPDHPQGGVGGAGTTGSVAGTACATGSMTLTQAYADLNSDGLADMAGANTVAGAFGGSQPASNWRAIRMAQCMWASAGINGFEGYGLIEKSTADQMFVDIMFDKISNFWTNQRGQRVVFEYYSTGYQLGCMSTTRTTDQFGNTVWMCTGAEIKYHITGYKIV